MGWTNFKLAAGSSTMTKEILYSVANDAEGTLTKVSDAVKGKDYYCLECKNKLILKRSGKTGKGSRRPHFSHSIVSTNCTPESVLHFAFKKFLASYLVSLLTGHQALTVSWTCRSCGAGQTGNLLEHVVRVEEEYDLSVCRPDIALLDSKGCLVAAIEIVVTHAPEPSAVHYYREGGVVLVQINLESDEDLDRVQDKIASPSIFDYCSKPRCSNYRISTTSRTVLASRRPCGRCFSPVELYNIGIQTPFGQQTTREFSAEEIELVKSQRPNIEVRENHSAGERFPIFVCMNCKRLQSRYRPKRRF